MSDVNSILGLGTPSAYIPQPSHTVIPKPQTPLVEHMPTTGFAQGTMVKEDDPLFPMPPQIFVGFYLNKGTPPPVLEKAVTLMTALLKTRFSVRYKISGDQTVDTYVMNALQSIHTNNTVIEVIRPWKDFGAEYLPLSQHYVRPSYQVKRITASLFSRWPESKPIIRTFKACELQVVLGKTGSSPAIAVITWSNDGSERIESLTEETKYHKFVYRLAKMWNVPIINLNASDATSRLEHELVKYPYVAE